MNLLVKIGQFVLTRLAILAIVFLVLFESCQPTEDGIKIDRFSSGNVKSIRHYKNGKLDGECLWFYRTGILESKVIYVNGLENGNAHYFYISGALKSQRFWTNGKMTGFVADYWDDKVGMIKHSLYFNDSGQLIYKKSFDSLGHLIRTEGSINGN